MFKRLKDGVRRFFFPPPGSPRWVMVLPYAILGVLTLSVLVGGAYAWDYTNSSQFCGTTCHTMPPEYAAYQISPHARVECVECHIGREFIGNQIFRKAGDIKHIVSLTFEDYEFPLSAKSMRPARETCERCHSPEKFSDDSLRVKTLFGNDLNNTPSSLYLILKTGGGAKRENLGRGIHWHIVNKVVYYAVDKAEQVIPYIRVFNDDGTISEYIDVESGFDPSTIDESKLKEMDCISCHNRITHRVFTPEESMDSALTRNLIDTSIPEIRNKGVEVMRGEYTNMEQALTAIAGLENYYQTYYSDYYSANRDKINSAIQIIQNFFRQSVYFEQKVDWNSHPQNIGHQVSPGCFRCHDGKHLNAQQEAVRLECNVCHSIPVVAGTQDFVAQIEISRGPEPEMHRNPNWITLHRSVFDPTCANCHSTGDPGGVSNTSFCSNSACHGNVYTFAGFDAPKLREVLQAQLPTPEPVTTPTPVVGKLTYDSTIASILTTRCGMCHGSSPSAGLNVTTYAALLKGGTSGPALVRGNSAGSRLVQIQSRQHFATLSQEELSLLKQWIDAGAPEK